VLAAVDPVALQRACGDNPSWICRNVLSVTNSEGWANAADYLATPLHILFVLVVAIVINAVVRRVMRRFGATLARHAEGGGALLGGAETGLRLQSRIRTIDAVLCSTASVVIFLMATLVVLSDLNVNLGPFIAGAGIAGVALGFGAQSLVRDVLTGFFILVEDQCGVGDVVDLGEAIGTVEAVTLRTTRLRDVNGTMWYVPNGEILRIGNKSHEWARAVLDVVVAHGTPLAQASQVLADTAAALCAEDEWKNDVLDAPELWGVESIDTVGVTLRLAIRTRPATQFRLLRELRARVNDALEAAGIATPSAVARPGPPATP
jgi:small conductance mechanosensitive channel